MTAGPRHGKPYSARRRRSQDLLVGLAGLIALLVGGALLVVTLPQALAEERDFLSASVCQEAPSEDCLHSAWFTVETVHVQRGKQAGGWVHVSGPEEGADRVRFSGLGEFLEKVRPGDHVAGTIWRGEIVVLSNGSAGQRAVSHPVGDTLFTTGTGILLILGGAFVTYVAWFWLHTPVSSARPHRTDLTADASATALLGMYTFALMMVLHDRDGSLGVFLALWTPAAMATCAFLGRRYLRHGARR
ncbi:hypothetical protein [Streptomyces narbonensis]|uniref:hypothetical protein n=1 Tax=Streptomyces narbonensis TaxID=67333 RepID=UPI00167641FE|nr:hypothetical protein [Streptomyces narbonensis]GGW12615.1 hypothetical protein GCM10010230_68240 [Streptomyces narbonensis]